MKHVLFVTYYFPPSGGPGVQRSLKFVKYLPDFGWQPHVLTVDPDDAAFPDVDPQLEAEVAPTLHVERTAAWDPYALYARMLGSKKEDVVSVGFLGEAEMNRRQRIARWVRGNVFLPDARVGWVPYAIRRGKQMMRGQAFDAIVTTGPPHSAHLVGRRLSSQAGTPWVVDFRDPWTGIDYALDLPMSAPAKRMDAWLEGRVLRQADACAVVSTSMARTLRSRYSLPVEVIENGFDPADFRGDVSPASDKFVIAHVGNLNAARNPIALWDALLNTLKDAPQNESQSASGSGGLNGLSIQLTGNVEPAVLATARDRGLESVIEVLPYVPHEQAVERMRRANMLLLCINNVEGAEGIVTGKLYEYLASGRPVLGIGPPNGDAAQIIEGAGAGAMYDFNDAAGVANFVADAFAKWKSGLMPAGATPGDAARYSRRELTGRLASLLDSLVNTADAPGREGVQP